MSEKFEKISEVVHFERSGEKTDSRPNVQFRHRSIY